MESSQGAVTLLVYMNYSRLNTKLTLLHFFYIWLKGGSWRFEIPVFTKSLKWQDAFLEKYGSENLLSSYTSSPEYSDL